MWIPIVNRFTCTRKQLPNIMRKIQNNNMKPILDYANENNEQHIQNYKAPQPLHLISHLYSLAIF